MIEQVEMIGIPIKGGGHVRALAVGGLPSAPASSPPIGGFDVAKGPFAQVIAANRRKHPSRDGIDAPTEREPDRETQQE